MWSFCHGDLLAFSDGKFPDFDEHQGGGGLNGPVAAWGIRGDYYDRDDLERVRRASGHSQLAALHVGNIDHGASSRAVLFGVDDADCSLQVLVEDLHKSLHLLLSIADQH